MQHGGARGMNEKLGHVAYEPETAPRLGMPTGADWRPRRYGEEAARTIDTAVRELTDAAFKRRSRSPRPIASSLINRQPGSRSKRHSPLKTFNGSWPSCAADL